MPLHPSTFGYLNPTAAQKDQMQIVREAAAHYAKTLEIQLPEGPDKTYILRKLRDVAMWANVTITRLPDGTPRQEAADPDVKMYPADHPVEGDLGRTCGHTAGAVCAECYGQLAIKATQLALENEQLREENMRLRFEYDRTVERLRAEIELVSK